MKILKNLLLELKECGATGIKISFEDEGALLNEMITMRYLTACVGLDMSVKIGGCEAKREIVDCINLVSDGIVAPMVESKFSLVKFLSAVDQYKYEGQKGFNLETIQSYNNLHELESIFNKIDFITFGRVDFAGSLGKSRDYVNSSDIFDMICNVFQTAKKYGIMCYLGGAISVESKEFIQKLTNLKLLDKFETRYVMFDANKTNNIELGLYLANLFEVEWLKYVSEHYNLLAQKDKKRIDMIESRLEDNPCRLRNFDN